MGASLSDTDGDDDDFGETHEINVTPFIDVILVLLIIFMVAAPLSTVDLPVDLPSSTATPQKKPDKPTYVTIQADLAVAIGETPVKHVILASVGDLLGFPKGMIVDFVLRRVKKAVPAFSLPRAVRFNKAVAGGRGRKLEKPEIRPEDIRIDTMRASGAGGQHVNTTDSAVRITHLPTGLIVTSSEKSQHQNRAKAMQVLRSRLYDIERQKVESERSADRKSQVGSGDRSERIRTYNFPQGRVTDHRINLTLYKLDRMIEGEIDELVDALIADYQAGQLAQLGEQL